ncbi:MAG TPA: hypothetical protein VGO73_01360 [Pyrinomonadaceae bacterium]|jgi:aspartate carbamoyltransferase catalytic subunit|nr:hypothetical protein [Pyrinomonadaceae bacterium]
MNWDNFGHTVETLIGAFSQASFVTLVSAFLIGYIFKSRVLNSPLRTLVEYFGNVTVVSPQNRATEGSVKQETSFVKVRS